ncbi:MAG TPA: 3-hydroxyacyl-CoA dehydrogenase family protein [Candidatus Limnocylindria bacterium]|nr:3-hydroxyacyl-CoA dehydrogenase family protein [Candidatus Limnocylindria bacterium]
MLTKKVAVVGAGTMGSGIAQVFALGACEVRITDSDPRALNAAIGKIHQSLEAMSEASFIKATEAQQAVKRIVAVPELRAAVRDVEIVTESIPERLELKQKIFAELENLAPESAVLASNTSSLLLSDMGHLLRDESRLIVTHYFNPAHILPTVEVIASPATSTSVVDQVCRLLASVGKTPIVLLKEIRGFVVNRIQAAMVREALFLLEQGITTADELDRAIQGSIGARLAVLGPFKVMDLGGLDVWAEVMRNLFPQLNDESTVPFLIDEKLRCNQLGAKSGRGFYEWSPRAAAEKTKQLQQQLMQIQRKHLSMPCQMTGNWRREE